VPNARFSLVALRHRLSPVLPLSLASGEVAILPYSYDKRSLDMSKLFRSYWRRPFK